MKREVYFLWLASRQSLYSPSQRFTILVKMSVVGIVTPEIGRTGLGDRQHSLSLQATHRTHLVAVAGL